MTAEDGNVELDDNLELAADGAVQCRHCAAVVGKAGEDPLSAALRRERPATEAGPGVRAAPHHYTSREIVLRQAFCPGCYAVLATEIVPQDEPRFRGWRLG
jgi:hypothetical protein